MKTQFESIDLQNLTLIGNNQKDNTDYIRDIKNDTKLTNHFVECTSQDYIKKIRESLDNSNKKIVQNTVVQMAMHGHPNETSNGSAIRHWWGKATC